MTRITAQTRPDWLTDKDEMPHDPGADMPSLWCENYLSYVWSPANELGIYVHLCRKPGAIEVWDEQVIVALPGDRYLLAKGFSEGVIDQGPSVAGIHMRCEEPFARWTKRFRGGARLVSGDEYREGPLIDGEHVAVEWETAWTPFSPPFDFGSGTLDQAWAVGHYEQHHRVTGTLRFLDETYDIAGTGMRDHSWGARDYREIGTTTWLHGQFPGSGRWLMAVLVTGMAPKPPFAFALIGDGDSVTVVEADGVPSAGTLEETASPYVLTLSAEDGPTIRVSAEVVNQLRAALVGPGEIALGTFSAPVANHHYVDAFTRFDWDGDIGYGITERSVDLQ
jgi:hypothetical protein